MAGFGKSGCSHVGCRSSGIGSEGAGFRVGAGKSAIREQMLEICQIAGVPIPAILRRCAGWLVRCRQQAGHRVG